MKRNIKSKREYSVIIERDSTGLYVGSVPTLAGCHSQAKSLDLLMKRMKKAIELCLEECDDSKENFEFIGLQRIAL